MANRKFYAWAGQNATTGTPHPITGRMSMYGDNFVFDSKSDRDEFVSDWDSCNPSEYCVACSRRELRGYNLGCSVQTFEDDLQLREMAKTDDGLCLVN